VTLLMNGWARAEVVDNEFVGAADIVDLTARGSLAAHLWRHNTYGRDPAARAWRYQSGAYDLASWQAATGLGHHRHRDRGAAHDARVFVRTEQIRTRPRDDRRLQLGTRPTVSVDVSRMLRVGARFELRNVQDLFGPPP